MAANEEIVQAVEKHVKMIRGRSSNKSLCVALSLGIGID